MQHLTVEIVLTKRKTSLVAIFPQLLKIMKKRLETFESKRFNWDRAWKNKNKNQNNAFCLPLISFFTQSSQYQIWKANSYSNLTNGNRTWTTSAAVIHLNLKPHLNLETPLILNINFIKEKSKISYPYVSNWNLPDLYLTYSHNHCTMFNFQYDGEPWNNSGDHSLPLNWLCNCTQNPYQKPRVVSKPNKNQPPFA